MIKILITGIDGFLGKNFIESISNNKNYKVLGITRKIKEKYPKNLIIIKSDLEKLSNSSLKKIKKFKPSVLLNFAWHGIPDYSYKNSLKNLKMHVNFLNLIFQISSVKKIIMTGSCWEYYDGRGKCSEDDDSNMLNAFSISKKFIYDYTKKVCDNLKLDFVWFRIFFVYGKYQKKKSLIPSILSSLNRKEKPKIINPDNRNDFIHIDDVCSAINLAVLKRNIRGIYNLGSGKTVDVKTIYNKILSKLNIKNNKFKLQKTKKINIKANYASIKKMKLHSKWKPRVNLSLGLDKTIKFYNG